MATRTWRVDGGSGTHVLTLHHGYITGRAMISIDGEPVFYRHRKWVDFGLAEMLNVGGFDCLVQIEPTFRGTFQYRLLIDGVEQQPDL